MYLALRPPWGGGATTATAPIDAGVVSVAPSDAGPAGKKKRPRRPRTPGTTAPGDLPTIDGTFGDNSGEGDYEETEPLAQLSASDRALEWRGDDVTLPPTKIDMAGGKDARPLDDGEINATIGAQSSGVRSCVVNSATNTDLHATIMVKMVVGADGRVTKSRIQAPRYLFEKGLLTCVQRSLGKMKFPATGAPTSVSLPVTLS
jgi:hypothetical protein